MGVLNVTPNSFSDGGRWTHVGRAVGHALRMIGQGADLVDIGGESTRPGAQAVPVGQELDRVIPVIEGLAGETDALISIDTSKPEVMRAAVGAGAAMINDVWALRRDGAMQAAAELDVAVCLMHMQGEPGTMQAEPHYEDVAAEVRAFLLERAENCRAAGIPQDRIVIDPGFGFGKTLEHNVALFRALPELAGGPYPVLAGLSRKSMLGVITGRGVESRLPASLIAALLAVQSGVAIVRVHDVAETVDALKVLAALGGAEQQ